MRTLAERFLCSFSGIDDNNPNFSNILLRPKHKHALSLPANRHLHTKSANPKSGLGHSLLPASKPQTPVY